MCGELPCWLEHKLDKEHERLGDRVQIGWKGLGGPTRGLSVILPPVGTHGFLNIHSRPEQGCLVQLFPWA